MNPPQGKSGGCQFAQHMVDQRPYFERKKTVQSRKMGIRRPTLRKPKTKFL